MGVGPTPEIVFGLGCMLIAPSGYSFQIRGASVSLPWPSSISVTPPPQFLVLLLHSGSSQEERALDQRQRLLFGGLTGGGGADLEIPGCLVLIPCILNTKPQGCPGKRQKQTQESGNVLRSHPEASRRRRLGTT